MDKLLMFATAFLGLALPAYAGGITAKEAEQLPAPALAAKSFADFANNLKAKSIWSVPTDTGYALFIAQFGAPMVEAAPGICEGRSIKFEYTWDDKNVARPSRVDTIDTYAVVGPIPEDKGPFDHATTITRCAELRSFGPHVFTADSDIDAISAMHLLRDVKNLAAGTGDFSISCTGYDCSHARAALAELNMRNILEVHGCGDGWFQGGLEHVCAAAMLSDDSQKAENGPDILFVKIKRDDDKVSVVLKRDHTHAHL